MVARDRTSELQSIFERAKAQRAAMVAQSGAQALATQGQSSVALAARAGPSTSLAASKFSLAAADFSRELSGASETIGNLTKLIQTQNVFDDQAGEIGSLAAIVKTKLSKLHDDLSVLAMLREESTVGTAASQSNRHSETVVTALRSQLVTTSQSFKAVLQKRGQAMKETHQRRNRFTSDKPMTFESALFQHQQDHNSAAGMGLSAGAGHGNQQEQQQLLASNNVQHFRQRHDAVRQIEAAVQEVSEMFHDFTRLVHEQEETIVRIDNDTEEALQNVNAGSGELMKYIASLSSGRGLMLKILGILFVFLLFFGFVVVR